MHSGYTFSLVHVFPGNRTHNLLRNRRNALPLSQTGTYVSFLKGRIYLVNRTQMMLQTNTLVSEVSSLYPSPAGVCRRNSFIAFNWDIQDIIFKD